MMSKKKEVTTNVKAPKICRHYLRRSCKHGAAGKGCAFAHPRPCKKFIRSGSGRGGCKEGKKCKFFHPPVCRSFSKDGSCNRDSCNFLHIKTEKAENPKKVSEPIQRVSRPTSYAEAASWRPATNNATGDVAAMPKTDGTAGQQPAFLGLQNQVTILQQQYQTILGLLTSNKQEANRGQCHCRH